MASAAAGAFNQIAERDLDARMQRTRNRAFVTGRLTAGPPWVAPIAATGVAGVGLALVALNIATAIYTFLRAFPYAGGYTSLLHRPTWSDIVRCGLASHFSPL